MTTSDLDRMIALARRLGREYGRLYWRTSQAELWWMASCVLALELEDWGGPPPAGIQDTLYRAWRGEYLPAKQARAHSRHA
jgi:hypothetical protein